MVDDLHESDPALMPLDRLLTRTGLALHRFAQRCAAAQGFSATSLGVLGVLDRGDSLSHRELSGRLGLAPATLTPVVDALVAMDALTRERDHADRRVVRLAITRYGRERLAAASIEVARMFRECVPRPGPEHTEIVRGYLLAVLAAVDDGVGRS